MMMARMSDLHTLTGAREDLICRVAETAGILHDARAAGAAVPVVCLLDCDPRNWIRWGTLDRCTNRGTPALSADTWHRLLVGALRASVATPTAQPERRAA